MFLKNAIVGNERVVKLLEKSYQSDKLAHAYLFSGPDSLGKKTLALAFCKLILNDEREDIKNNPDLIVLRPDEDKKQIVIEQIREFQKSIVLFPYSAKYKIAIIEQAEMMTKAAANAILKTLEEPCKTTILILLTSNSGALLETIKSRCQILKFFSIKEKLLEEFVQKKVDNSSEVEKIISLAEGKPGKIIEIINDREKLKELSEIIEFITDLTQKSDFEKLNEAEIISKKELSEIIDLLNLYSFCFRKKLLKEYRKTDRINKKRIEKIKDIIDFISITKKNLLTKNVNIRLVLENLFLQI